MKLKSPLIPDANARVISRISSEKIVAWYHKTGIDVTEYFENIPEVLVAECELSGFRFYAPEEAMGQGEFYQRLSDSRGSEYYPAARWEHKQALHYFKPDNKVLEIGPGHLAFARLLKEAGVTNITGLEINPTSFDLAKKLGVTLLNESVTDHTVGHEGAYDVVCSFQVLEHVYDVHSYLDACARLLKPGGTLIVAVPNNDSFIQGEELAYNAPPHHMGLWSESVLTSLPKYFPLSFKKLWREPLRKEEASRWMHWKEKGLIRSRVMRVLLYRLRLRHIIIFFIQLFRKRFRGQSMLAIFTKQ